MTARVLFIKLLSKTLNIFGFKMMGSVMIWVLQIISLSPVTLNPKKILKI